MNHIETYEEGSGNKGLDKILEEISCASSSFPTMN